MMCYYLNVQFQGQRAKVGRDSSVDIATTLRAVRPGDRILVGVRFSAPVQTVPGAHTTSYTIGA